MSQIDAPEKQPRSKRVRRKKSLQSGFSLLARGEPQIWFIGGMLVVCLAMIAGLLGLILSSGVPSFWPRQVDWMVLNDGTQEIGQPHKTRSGILSEDDDNVSINTPEGTSYYYRTGNYDLTGKHYRWIDSTQISALGIATPPSAMVIERLEWGRLYGIPLQFSEIVSVDPTALEDQHKLDQFISAIESHATTDDSVEVINQLRQLRQYSLSAELSEALEQIEKSEGEVIQVQRGEGSEWATANQEPLDDITAVRRLFLDRESSAQMLTERLPTTIAMRRKVERVQLELSHLDSKLAKSRAAIRRAEIDSDDKIAAQVDQVHYLLEQKELFEYQGKLLEQSQSWISDIIKDDQIESAVLAEVAGAMEALPESIASNDEQIADWLEPVLDQSTDIQLAAQNYIDGFLQVAASKRPLQREIETLEAELLRMEIRFLVPSNPTTLDDLDASTTDQLLDGTISDALKDILVEQAIEVADFPPVVTSQGDQLTFVVLRSETDELHGLSIVAQGYISDSESKEKTVSVLSTITVPIAEVVRAVPVNQLSLGGKLAVYGDRWREFLFENPREANAEGGVFPAIWGTIVMTLIMTIAVVPFGVMAALYLREYAGSGPLVSIIRISINNLAGVPSIVYGVFGFSFFCYTVGAYIDGGPENADIQPWPSSIWFMAVGAAAIIGTAAFFASFLGSGTSRTQTAGKKILGRMAICLWLTCLAILAALILKSPFFNGFYQEYLPNPTFGKGGLLWASLTLSLLTLPVVIVATEEALSAVPNSLREGSLACGASKWQTIRRIVLPHARPGILTGAILAMARGAGEVAPLMLVGALPTAPDLPLDGEFPFFHGSRSFMHLGYQIYVLGFQSQNSDAAVPMVFTCTLLLILIVAVLNIFAILLRARLKKRFQGNQF